MDTNVLDAFGVPEKGTNTPQPPSKTDKSEAFFAANIVAKDAPIDTYNQIIDEVSRTGYSPILEDVRQTYAQEKDKAIRQKANEIIVQEGFTPQQKREALELLVIGGDSNDSTPAETLFLDQVDKTKDVQPKSLKNFTPLPGSKKDNENAEIQKSFLDKAREAGIRIVDQFNVFASEASKSGFWSTVKDTAEAAATVGSVLVSAPYAGYAGLFYVLAGKEQEAEKAMALVYEGIYKGDGKVYEEGMKLLGEVGTLLDIPFQAAGDITHDSVLALTKNQTAASAAGGTIYGVSQMFGYVAGGYGTVKAVSKGASVVESIKAGAKAASPIPTTTTKTAEDVTSPTGRVEPVFEKEVLWIDPESPLGKVARRNRPLAADMAAKAVVDNSGRSAEAMGASLSEIITNYALPARNTEVDTVFPDIGTKLEELDQKFKHYFDANKVDPYLFDVAAINRDVDMHRNFLIEQAEETPMLSSSFVEDTGRAFRGNIVFGKADNTGWKTDELQDLLEKVTDFRVKVGSMYKVNPSKVKVETFVDDVTGETFFKWEFFRAYDPNENTFFGLGSNQALFAGADITSVANTVPGKFFISPAARLAPWLTAGAARATIRSTNLDKVWSAAIRNDVLSVKKQKELAQAIYETESKGQYHSPQMLREMFPEMVEKDFKELVLGYNVFRRLNDHLYTVTNTVYRNQKVTQNLRGLYDSKGRYVNNLGRKVEPNDSGVVELPSATNKNATEVYDFSLVDDVTGDPERQVRKGVTRVTEDMLTGATAVYRLDKPIKVDGKVIYYGTGLKDGKIPENLLPNIPGYYPHINVESYYVKAIPKKLVIDGHEVPKDGSRESTILYEQAASTLYVARTQKEADATARKLARQNSDFEYVGVMERTRIEDNLSTHLEAVQFAQDTLRSRRADRLTYGDGGLGRLEDPVVSLNKRLQQIAKVYSFKDWDFEFRNNWKNSFGMFVTDKTLNGFPSKLEDISLPPGKIVTDLEQQLFVTAKNSFEQYLKIQRHSDTFLDPIWRGVTLKVARLLEEKSPKLSETALKMHDAGEPFLSSMLKLSTFKYIHANPLRQYLVQPAQLYELVGLSLLNKNPGFVKDLSFVAPAVFRDILMQSEAFKTRLPGVSKFFSDKHADSAKIDKNEYARIVKAFNDSGIASAINMHAVIDGVFKHSDQRLDISNAERTLSKATGLAKGAISLPRRVGFDAAELFNNIGLWLYARSEFIKNNPKAKWDDPTNLEKIAAKAWGVGNGMLTRGDLFPYQDGSLRFLMQFMAYSNKAVLQPFTSKFLTKEEKIRLATIRLLAFGERGIPGGAMVTGIIENAADNLMSTAAGDVEKETLYDQFIQLWKRGASDALLNSFLGFAFDDEESGVKTDLLISKDISPSPETTVPMGDFIIDMLAVLNKEGSLVSKTPALQAGTALFDTINFVQDTLFVGDKEPETEGEALKYIGSIAEFTSGWSNFEKALAMNRAGTIVDKFGNSMELETTFTEVVAKVFGLQSNKEKVLYDVMMVPAKLDKEIKASAKKAVDSFERIEKIYGVAEGQEEQLEQLNKRINLLVDIYASNGLENEYTEAILNELAARGRKGISGPLDRLHNYYVAGYEDERRKAAELLLQIKNKAGKDYDTALENMFYDSTQQGKTNGN